MATRVTTRLTGQPTSTGTYYSVDNSVYVTMRDLTKMGKILSTAVSSGANSINSIQFDVADKTKAMMTEARQKAMANASSLASELAQTAGLKLGAIQNVTYSDNSPYLIMGWAAAARQRPRMPPCRSSPG